MQHFVPTFPVARTLEIVNAMGDQHEQRLAYDLAGFAQQVNHDNLDINGNLTWVAGSIAMCIGAGDEVNPRIQGGIRALYNAIVMAPNVRNNGRRLWRSLIQQITPEHRQEVRQEMAWYWEGVPAGTAK